MDSAVDIVAHIIACPGDTPVVGMVESFAKMLPGYQTTAALRFGSPGPEIIQFAKEGGFDAILMTRSSRGSTQKLGSVSTYIVQNASFITTTVLREA